MQGMPVQKILASNVRVVLVALVLVMWTLSVAGPCEAQANAADQFSSAPQGMTGAVEDFSYSAEVHAHATKQNAAGTVRVNEASDVKALCRAITNALPVVLILLSLALVCRLALFRGKSVMLLVVIGLLVIVTMMITGKVSEQETLFMAKQAALEQRMNAKGKVVYTVKDIPEGQEIPAEALEEREIEQCKIPQDAVTSANLVAGRIAKYGISTGQIVSQHDLAPLRDLSQQ